jgi:aminoglycoside phosphotransferase family enzyme
LMPESFARLQHWYQTNEHLLDQAEQRRLDGRVRDCHGDLHLDNIALIDNEVMPFDCIEFNPELRWIDTISEAAFVAMDLQARGYSDYCWRFINRYLENSADYDSIQLLRSISSIAASSAPKSKPWGSNSPRQARTVIVVLISRRSITSKLQTSGRANNRE